jgi:hypothetical protein
VDTTKKCKADLHARTHTIQNTNARTHAPCDKNARRHFSVSTAPVGEGVGGRVCACGGWGVQFDDREWVEAEGVGRGAGFWISSFQSN